ncbi:ABC transporter substrate-binding protein [Komagataeibacter sp. FXV3]|uniref:ABC transporter substrate-binding protein n=1 Tax=Komagataeibacter sp. FXV3 TaxID=2608998 RepID=UPI00187B9E15|nr:ABC transporter substrate-binding protein [Komagataeibacter sp. FXV3]MBE7728590.1 ABC transporter substrate-binding protein [Komagataeibacter sp. FXV3]
MRLHRRQSRSAWTAVRSVLATGCAMLFLSGNTAGYGAAAVPLVVGINPVYPPMEFHAPETGELQGFDVDFAYALGKQMGRPVEIREASFPQLMVDVGSGRIDIIISGLNDTPGRRGVLQFVDYLQSGAQLLVSGNSPFTRDTDLCGGTVSAARGTDFARILQAWGARVCGAAHMPDITVVGTENSAMARLELREGRVQAAVQGEETVGYFLDNAHSLFRRFLSPISHAYLAIAMRHDSALFDDISTDFEQLKKNGKYQSLLRKWHLEANTVIPS